MVRACVGCADWRGCKALCPCYLVAVAELVECETFNFGVMGASPIREARVISLILWVRAVVACQSHNLKVIGSNPIPTTSYF